MRATQLLGQCRVTARKGLHQLLFCLIALLSNGHVAFHFDQRKNTTTPVSNVNKPILMYTQPEVRKIYAHPKKAMTMGMG